MKSLGRLSNPSVSARPRLIVETKLDLPDAAQGLADLQAAYPRDHIIGISSFSREGLGELKKSILGLLSATTVAASGDEE